MMRKVMITPKISLPAIDFASCYPTCYSDVYDDHTRSKKALLEVRKPYSLGPAEEVKSAVTIIQTILVMLICRQYQNTLFNTSQQKGLQSRHILTMRCAPRSIMQDAQKLTETNSRLCMCRRHNSNHTYPLHFIFLSPLAFLLVNFYCCCAFWFAEHIISFPRKRLHGLDFSNAPEGSPLLQPKILRENTAGWNYKTHAFQFIGEPTFRV